MSSWLPSLNGLRAFESVSRHLNYRKAAEELHVSPGATNQLVRKLEDAVGGPLLEMKGRKLVLTPIGAVGHEGLSLPFRQIADTVERMRAMTGTQRFVVTTTPSFAGSWLVPRLERFKEANPGIDVLIDSTPQIVDMEFGVADVGIRFGVKDHGDLTVYRLFDEELCAFCSPRLVEGPPEITSLDHLAQAKLLRWDLSQFSWAENTRKWNYWKHWLAKMGAEKITPRDGLRFSDYNLAVQSAVAGQGFVIGSPRVLQDLIEANLLVNPFGRGVATDIGYDLVVNEVAMERAEVAAFVSWVMAEAGAVMEGSDLP
ncbi:LysR substrate-binding domain-containing protein [Pseudohalocynthiibacter aestuariivivens]|uniref:LysR substrate-binding domain-containing protein n=1 Tax=Pseudohalocynthiibacter aestuariivivens TaxID=1591409 RepID=A0ABV5JEM4_9RHOB|nr:LysR substrate-binding domain-containing protein [Pseudohalocynthiibacter aestuariivivens]MBS9718814.1 LysR family transcriptional regulator [Pseudohalocynthiibacter aestuariivivens]